MKEVSDPVSVIPDIELASPKILRLAIAIYDVETVTSVIELLLFNYIEIED